VDQGRPENPELPNTKSQKKILHKSEKNPSKIHQKSTKNQKIVIMKRNENNSRMLQGAFKELLVL